MKPSLSFIFSVIRNRTGATSAAEAAVGAVAGLLAVWAARKAGLQLGEAEVSAIIAAGPVISSQILGTARHVYNDIMTAFQRGISESHDK